MIAAAVLASSYPPDNLPPAVAVPGAIVAALVAWVLHSRKTPPPAT